MSVGIPLENVYAREMWAKLTGSEGVLLIKNVIFVIGAWVMRLVLRFVQGLHDIWILAFPKPIIAAGCELQSIYFNNKSHCATETNEGKVAAFMDDVLVETEIEEGYDEIVEEILKRLEENDLYVKPEKCMWKEKKIGFLGVVIGPNGIEMEAEKVDRVLSWPQPKNVKDNLGPHKLL